MKGLFMKGLAAAWLGAGMLGGCAIPFPPTGGPPDDTPPYVLESMPAAEAVNVSTETIRIAFSERIRIESFQEALSIVPAPDTPPELSWRGARRVDIRLSDPLRPNTTYLLTLDTSLRDLRRVALKAPITIAFSTGPVINAGTLSGRVVQSSTGEPIAGMDVLAYPTAGDSLLDRLPARPAYRTQTDPTGTFRFTHLTEQPYFVVALEDANRNLKPDVQELFASPPLPVLPADSGSAQIDVPWISARIDTVAPTPLWVRSLASSRHVLRFTEEIRLVGRDPAAWTLHDSTSGQSTPVLDIYVHEAIPQQVSLTTPPLDAVPFVLRPAAVADTSGNLAPEHPIAFTPAASEDTIRLRFEGFLPMPGVLPVGVEPSLRFNIPPGDTLLDAAVVVLDSTGTASSFSLDTQDGTTWHIALESARGWDTPGEIRVDGTPFSQADTVFTASYWRIDPSETGEIRGIVASDTHPVLVESHPVDTEIDAPPTLVRADSSGAFLFRDLPAGTWRLRAWADLDANGRWNEGMVHPYLAPEPIAWTTEPVQVRARWETTLPDTLLISGPLQASSDH